MNHACFCVPTSIFAAKRTALRFAESAGHDEVACILKVDPAVCTLPEAAAAGRVHEVWALMRQASYYQVVLFIAMYGMNLAVHVLLASVGLAHSLRTAGSGDVLSCTEVQGPLFRIHDC